MLYAVAFVGSYVTVVAFLVGSYVVGAGDTVGASVVFVRFVNCRAYSSLMPRRRLSEAMEAPKLSTRRNVEANFILCKWLR